MDTEGVYTELEGVVSAGSSASGPDEELLSTMSGVDASDDPESELDTCYKLLPDINLIKPDYTKLLVLPCF